MADNIITTWQLIETLQDVSITPSVFLSNKEDNSLIIFDSGASISITPFLSDFIDESIDPATSNLSGLTDQAQVGGTGTVSWTLCNDFGTCVEVNTPTYYVLNAKVGLFSPQKYFA